MALCVKPEFTLLCLECCQHSKGDDARVMWREKVGLMGLMRQFCCFQRVV